MQEVGDREADLFRFYYVIACGGMERMTGSRK